MTRRPADEPLRKITLDIFKKDYEFLHQAYPEGKVATVIRGLIRTHITELELKEEDYDE